MPWEAQPETDPDDPTAPCRACYYGPNICYRPDTLCGGDAGIGAEGYPGWVRARWDCDGCGITHGARQYCLWDDAPCCEVAGLTFCFECMAKVGQVLVERMATLERIDERGGWQTMDVDGEWTTVHGSNPIRALLTLVPVTPPEVPTVRWPAPLKLLPDG